MVPQGMWGGKFVAPADANPVLHGRRASGLPRGSRAGVHTRRNTSEVLMPPKAKLLLIAYSVSSARGASRM
ncbi:MAG: hypothetical protein OMOMHJEC_03185 [Xanthomonadales bacterium]|nr:hypothetical protein [Xanthomonadales bacterium]